MKYMSISVKPSLFSIVRLAAIAFVGISLLVLTTKAVEASGFSIAESMTAIFGSPTESGSSGEVMNDGLVAPELNGSENLVSTTIVISQAYGGGGGTTGTYMNDYVELK